MRFFWLVGDWLRGKGKRFLFFLLTLEKRKRFPPIWLHSLSLVGV